MKLGLVTYYLAHDWDCDTIIANCKETGFEGVEPRAEHAHGIETTLSKTERDTVRKKFEDADIEIVGLGTIWEYDSPDPAELQRNIEGTRLSVQLAHDLGVGGIKVRPNRLHEDEGIDAQQTLEQIGRAGAEVAAFAADEGVEIRMEVHGPGTCKVSNMKTIMDVGNHPNLKICWNCNDGETADGSPLGTIKPNFDLLKDKIALVHIQDIGVERYPWQELFQLLKDDGYQGYCLAEIQPIDQPVRLMHYFKALWGAQQQLLDV